MEKKRKREEKEKRNEKKEHLRHKGEKEKKDAEGQRMDRTLQTQKKYRTECTTAFDNILAKDSDFWCHPFVPGLVGGGVAAQRPVWLEVRECSLCGEQTAATRPTSQRLRLWENEAHCGQILLFFVRNQKPGFPVCRNHSVGQTKQFSGAFGVSAFAFSTIHKNKAISSSWLVLRCEVQPALGWQCLLATRACFCPATGLLGGVSPKAGG